MNIIHNFFQTGYLVHILYTVNNRPLLIRYTYPTAIFYIFNSFITFRTYAAICVSVKLKITILELCREAKVYGVICYGIGLTLREGNREYFYRQLDRFFPKIKEKYIRLYGNRYEVESPDSQRLMELFHRTCKDYGIVHDNEQIFRYLYTFEEKNAQRQLNLWNFGV